MPNKRSIDILKEARHQIIVEHQRTLAELDRDIARLELVAENEPGVPVAGSNGSGGYGRYHHMSMRTAVEAYMSGFPRGTLVPVVQITEALRDGQVMIGKDKRKPKRLPDTKEVRTLISNSGRKKYIYDRVKDAVMLPAEEIQQAS